MCIRDRIYTTLLGMFDDEMKQEELEKDECYGCAYGKCGPELVLGVWKEHKDLNKILSGLSQNWRFERIGRIELTLLQIALFEMLNRPDVPPKVAINEAVELAKQFGDENSKNFVNGMLDAVAKAMESGKIKPHWA